MEIEGLRAAIRCQAVNARLKIVKKDGTIVLEQDDLKTSQVNENYGADDVENAFAKLKQNAREALKRRTAQV